MLAGKHKPVKGIYQQAGRAEALPAFALPRDDGSVEILNLKQEPLQQLAAASVTYGPALPGLPVELQLPDGARFIPQDTGYRWPGLSARARLPGWLESHWLTVLAAVLILPLFLWLMMYKAIPAAADASVVLIPDSVARKTGAQTLQLLDRFYMQPSALAEQEQQAIRRQWHQVLDRLQLPKETYRLNFRRWDRGANAMALPNGDVILTDSIVALLRDHPEQLTAVMLHEIGHVEHQHSLRMMARATGSSILFALVFGDIEGAGELLIGAGASLVQSAFSRDMEREADAFAYTRLHTLGRPATDFADAMTRLMHSHGHTEADTDQAGPSLSAYLSSHPAIQERIEAARNWQPEH